MKKILIIVLVVITVPLSFATYMGVFNSLVVSEVQKGPYYLVYKKNKGAYEDLGPLFESMHKFAEDQDIADVRMFGIYYDDPKKVEKNSLRSEVGVILKDKGTFGHFRKKLIRESVLFKRLKKQSYAITEFPFRNMLSIFIGIGKAYPALEEYMKAKKGHDAGNLPIQDSFAMEIYQRDKIIYLIKIP